MTVSSTSSRAVFNGNGSQTAFPANFRVDQPSDLVVIYTDASGDQITLTSGQYTTDGAFGLAFPNGPTVTYNPAGGPIAMGTTLTLLRNTPATQPTSISNQGAMWPAAIEAALDRTVMIAQGFVDTAARSLKIGPTDSGTLDPLPNAAQRAGSYLAFDSQGQPVAAASIGNTIASSWMATNFLNQTGAATALSVLGGVSSAVANAWGAIQDFSGARIKVPTRAAGDNGTDAASTAFVQSAVLLRTFLSGLGTSNNGTTPNTKIDVAAGVCADSSNAMPLSYAGGTIDLATMGANGLDTGSLANSTSYHVFIVGKADGTTVPIASLSPAAPTMPSGYTLKRRIASFTTDGSAHVVPYLQDGNDFYRASIVTYSSTSTRALALLTVSVPTGIVVNPFLTASLGVSGAGNMDMQLAPGANSALSAIYAGTGTSPTTHAGSSFVGPPTNTSAQIYMGVTLTSGSIAEGQLFIKGWRDARGQNA